MPSIVPPGGEVDWPANEGALGVVGVAPWATLDFCRALYRQVDALKDWHYPRVLLDINTKLPSRGRHLQLGETDPSPAIAETIRELAAQGATVAVVVCNTAHILFERWAREAPVPVLHIIEETVGRARALGANRVVSLGSASLASSGLYEARVSAEKLTPVALSAENQLDVNELIAGVKIAGGLDDLLQGRAEKLLVKLKASGADTVIGGCTELSVLEALASDAGLQFVDSNQALALAALHRLGMSEDRVLS